MTFDKLSIAFEGSGIFKKPNGSQITCDYLNSLAATKLQNCDGCRLHQNPGSPFARDFFTGASGIAENFRSGISFACFNRTGDRPSLVIFDREDHCAAKWGTQKGIGHFFLFRSPFGKPFCHLLMFFDHVFCLSPFAFPSERRSRILGKKSLSRRRMEEMKRGRERERESRKKVVEVKRIER